MNAFFDSDVLAMKGPVGIPHIPPHLEHPEAITQYGQTWLWVGFGAMCVGVLAFTGTTLRAPYRYRLLHITTMLVSVIAAISYFAMASGVGSVLVHSTGRSTTREVFYARYIDWAFTTPLLLLDVTLLAGLPVGEIGLVVIADIIMVVTGGIAALHPSLKYRWGFYTFSCLAFAWVLYTLVTSGRSYAHLRSPKVGQLYNGVSLTLVAVWTAYPIVFFFSEGTGRLSADNEVLAYAILDIIAKPIWGLALLLAIPEEGHVAIPSWAASAGGSVSGGGYGAVPSANDA